MIALDLEPAVKRSWASLIVGVLIAFALVQWYRERLLINPEQAGLGTATSSVFGDGESGRVHCTDRRDEALCLAAYRKAGSPPAVLWLGNSQLHGLNRARPGQETAPMRLHRILRAKGLYLVAFSQPNANLDEDRYLFQRLVGQYRVTTLLLPVCLDDFREAGIRDTLKSAAPAGSPVAAKGGKNLQARVESAVNAFLSSHSETWHDRPDVQGGMTYAAYVLRNRLFGITAQTKRPVSQADYAAKMATLEGLLSDADRAGVHVVLYVPPFRRDVAYPYVDGQYAQFRQDLAAAAARHKARFLDLTDIVPGPAWGMLTDPIFGTDDYDFMHFTADGHRRLADSLARAF